MRQIEADPNQLNISASINSVCIMESSSNAALYTKPFKPERTGLIKFKCTWYKRESRSLARTSALDFNKEGCVIQIQADWSTCQKCKVNTAHQIELFVIWNF